MLWKFEGAPRRTQTYPAFSQPPTGKFAPASLAGQPLPSDGLLSGKARVVVVKERGCGWSKEERPFQLLFPILSRLIIEDKGDTKLLHSQDGVPVRDHVDLRAEG